MIEIVDANDSRAVRNKNNVLALYDLMINTKRSEEGTAKFVSPCLHPAQPADRRRCGRARESSLPRSHGNARGPASSSTASSPSATMYGRT